MKDKIYGAAGSWSIFCCERCNFFWLYPQSSPCDAKKFYANYHTHTFNDGKTRRRSILVSLKRKVECLLLETEYGYAGLSNFKGVRFVGKLLSALLPMAKEVAGSSVMWLTAKSAGKLLDVGCGNGSFLATMQNLGWKVMGVEPDAQSATIAREQFGIHVIQSELEDAKFPQRSFDCVTAHQTIEHMYDPLEFLKESFRILKPGGRLVITTPNVPSLGHTLFRRCWRGLEPPRHFYLFSPQALSRCAERAGFQVDVLRTTARSAWEIWYASRLIKRDGKIPGNFRDELNTQLRIEGMIFQLLESLLLHVNGDLGEQIVLIAVKPEFQSADWLIPSVTWDTSHARVPAPDSMKEN